MHHVITVLPGDGIGPEVTREAVRAIERIGTVFGHTFEVREALIGGAAVDATGSPLPQDTIRRCLNSSAVLLGAVGGDQWNNLPTDRRPEAGLLALRRRLGVFANLRPIRPTAAGAAACPIRPELLEGVDILFVRELTGGIYFGPKHRDEQQARDVCTYSVTEIERVARLAFRLAGGRPRGHVTSIDKANVLETSRLWRDVVTRVQHDEFPGVGLRHMLVDAASMHLLRTPRSFDVVLTENMFGDILTDEAAVLAGSLGVIPSASIGGDGPGLFEPIHGSAPDIAGRQVANPIGAILSAAMLLRHGIGLADEAEALESAVRRAMDHGLMTPDLSPHAPARTSEVTDAVLDAVAIGAPAGAGMVR